jgi:hypothetical protein
MLQTLPDFKQSNVKTTVQNEFVTLEISWTPGGENLIKWRDHDDAKGDPSLDVVGSAS